MPQLRKDPIVDRWVIIAESRSQRPGAFLAAEVAERLCRPGMSDAEAGCPFCIGNEALTPRAVHEKTGEDGRWVVRIVTNKYPAVSSFNEPDRSHANIAQAIGCHEVVIESPDHKTNLTELSTIQLECVLAAWRDRMGEHKSDGRWRIVQLFKNSGTQAGASLDHVHSQLLALNRVPPLVAEELEAASAYYSEKRQCAFCHFIAQERGTNARVVSDQSGFLVVAAFAGRQPYETWILPTEHESAFEMESNPQLSNLAAVLAQTLRALRRVLPVPAYNLILHSAPFDTTWGDRYHWHIEIIPRIVGLAGFELGGGQFINPVCPERAAREIKEILHQKPQL